MDGRHESEPVRVAMRAGTGRKPELLVLLWSGERGPVQVRIVVIGEHLVNSVDLDLDTADLLRAQIERLLEQARPPEHIGPVPPAPDHPIG